MNEIPVLDKGYVRLVDSMGSDMSVVRAARVSYDCPPRLDGSDDALIRYLMIHNHTSPFEHVVFTFEVKAPIFVFRQWHRHRTQSYNEMSARYTEMKDEVYIPDPDKIGVQSKSSKQARNFDDVEARSPMDTDYIRQYIETRAMHAFNTYKVLLNTYNVPRELARTVLPLGVYSKMFCTVNLHNLFHFLELRLHPHAQYEIKVYAETILKLIEPIVPVCVKFWKERDKFDEYSL